MKKFNINYHFISLYEISLGLNISLKDPCIQIHIPFGFVRIGWKEKQDVRKLFTFSSKRIIERQNMEIFESF